MNILGTPISKLKKLIESKQISTREVYDYFINRISKYDKDINAYMTIGEFPEKQAPLKGLLSGIPLAIKDNFCTNALRTTASSKVLDTFVPPYDATVVARLKQAGAYTLGKTNMDAWAHGSSTETSQYGPTKNPWDTSRAPGGSSGGSAAAVCAYLAPASIGSETAGSIRLPASWTGVVGLKPTYGRVSRYGVIAMGSSFDCPGPMTLTAEDAALILQVIAGHDDFDATSSAQKVSSYVNDMKKKKKYTIGIADEYFDGLDDDVKKSVQTAIDIATKMGHTIKKIKLISPKIAISVYTIIQRAEVSSNLARYDGIRYGENRSYMGDEAKRRIMLGTYTLSYGYYDAYYKKAQQVRTLIIEDFKRVFQEVDMILATPAPVTALKLGEFEKYPFFGELMDMLNEPSSIAGVPAVTFPGGLDRHGLPIGIQLMGNYFRESDLLNLTYQFEQETDYMGVIKKGFGNYE